METDAGKVWWASMEQVVDKLGSWFWGILECSKRGSDPTFEGSRCTVATDWKRVETRTLDRGFASLKEFSVFVNGVAL